MTKLELLFRTITIQHQHALEMQQTVIIFIVKFSYLKYLKF